MRQAGYLAAAGLYAIEHNIERLSEDHQHACLIAQALGRETATTLPPATTPDPQADPGTAQPIKACPFTAVALMNELKDLSAEGAEMLVTLIQSGQPLPPPLDGLNAVLPEAQLVLHLFQVFRPFSLARVQAAASTAKAAASAALKS